MVKVIAEVLDGGIFAKKNKMNYRANLPPGPQVMEIP